MRHIALRRILPIIQFVLFLTLFWLASKQEQAFYGEWDSRQSALSQRAKDIYEAQASTEGAVGWDPRHMWDGFEPPALKLLLAINCPAFLIAVPLSILVKPLTDEMWAYVAVGAFAVVLFWFLVGRLLDRTFGDLSPRGASSRQFRGGIFLWLAPLVFAAGFLSLWFLVGARRWLSLSLALWSAAFALFQYFKARQRKAQETSPATPPNPQ